MLQSRAPSLRPSSPAVRPLSDRELLALVGAVYVALTLAKLVIAVKLDLFWDEAYYWQGANRLDIGYADKPFMTAFLVRLGTSMFGDTPLGVRACYLAIASVLPFALYWLARPIVGRRDALLAVGASLVLPIGGLLGFLASPEIPMALFAVLGLGAMERAARGAGRGAWLLLGAACALGLATHYRFALFPFALFLFLVLTQRGRALWRQPGLWLAAGIAALGLLPILIFNLRVEFASFQYQILERNPWSFHAKGLLYPYEQALAVTPLYYVALLGTLVYVLRRAWAGGDHGAALAAICSSVYLGVYFVLSPLTDQKHFDVHWPGIGYMPLLLFLPEALRRFAAGGAGMARAARRAFCLLVPLTGAAGVVGVLYYVMANIWPGALAPTVMDRLFRYALVGWSELGAEAVTQLRALETQSGADGGPGRVVVAGQNYIVASELDFAMDGEDGELVFVLDHPWNTRDGVEFQYALWDLDQPALRRAHPGATALVVVEEFQYEIFSRRRVAWRAGLCSVFDDMRYLGEYEFHAGRRHFQFYAGRVRPPAAPAPSAASRPRETCPAIPAVYVNFPKRGGTVSGVTKTWGLVFDSVGVRAVDVVVDGRVAGRAEYHPGVSSSHPWIEDYIDPRVPYVHFGFDWDTTRLAEGPHQFALRLHRDDGSVGEYGRRTVFVVRP